MNPGRCQGFKYCNSLPPGLQRLRDIGFIPQDEPSRPHNGTVITTPIPPASVLMLAALIGLGLLSLRRYPRRY